jgi:hypothetical protein
MQQTAPKRNSTKQKTSKKGIVQTAKGIVQTAKGIVQSEKPRKKE